MMRYLNALTKESLGDTIQSIDLFGIVTGVVDSVIVEDTRPESHFKFTVYHLNWGASEMLGTQFESLKQAQDWNLSRKI